MYRLYFNLTNKCNEECPFCCMSSSPKNNMFLEFDKFKAIVDKYTKDTFEIQLEGGEPFLNANLYLFMFYAVSTKRCTKIIIDTNGKLLDKHLERLIDFTSFTNTEITIKPSINYWLIQKDKELLRKCRDLYYATEFIPNFNIIFNVRLRYGDEYIIEDLKTFKIFEQSNIFYLQNYGKWEDTNYSQPIINQNTDWWEIFATDGKSFGTNLIERANYEKELLN